MNVQIRSLLMRPESKGLGLVREDHAASPVMTYSDTELSCRTIMRVHKLIMIMSRLSGSQICFSIETPSRVESETSVQTHS